MGKKKLGVGQSLVKGKGRGPKHGDSWRHTREVNDGADNQRLNTSSITEQSTLDDFLATAQLAGTEFTAEKLNVTVVTPSHNEGIVTAEEALNIKQAQQENKKLLRIPRRPNWTTAMTVQELDLKERDAFIEWRRQLANLEEKDHITMTPYEKNIEFWRQLWRVIERSDVVVQIVDARDPLLFRCEDLEAYVKEVDSKKENLLLINKADYLTPLQRFVWAQYFKEQGIAIAFWSALGETERLQKEAEDVDKQVSEVDKSGIGDDSDDFEKDSSIASCFAELSTDDKLLHDRTLQSQEMLRTHNLGNCQEMHHGTTSELSHPTEINIESHQTNMNTKLHMDKSTDQFVLVKENKNDYIDFSGKLLSSNELIELCQNVSHQNNPLHTTIGMVGYPNVGKSSTINALLQHKKVAVSSTPGRTKHFQTLNLGKDVCLCDCPGLVFPSFVSTKAEMILSGILPIDQMRDHLPPVTLLCQRIPRQVLDLVYGINIVKPGEGEDPGRPPFGHELLDASGYMRGFMTSHGTPDGPRSSRYILKDFVQGKLLYCSPPPGVNAAQFQNGRFATGRFESLQKEMKKQQIGAEKPKGTAISSIDVDFFEKKEVRHFVKGTPVMLPGQPVEGTSEGIIYKPWKKHNNKNKREKLRRLEKKSS